MKEIDFLPSNYRRASNRPKRLRRIAVLAGLFIAYVTIQLTYETRLDRTLASVPGVFGDSVESCSIRDMTAGHCDVLCPAPHDTDQRVAWAERVVLGLLGAEYRLSYLSFETGMNGGLATATLHGRLRAVAENELAVGMFMGRLAASSYCSEIELVFVRAVHGAGRASREFELTFVLDSKYLPG
ncbi:MAG: hypothetical protein GXY44_13370 [Phycisphaerales bacterium]|mgnify:CR=1 FL=1|nr:hypothetical protein [Phycisphaerales bacterium]